MPRKERPFGGGWEERRAFQGADYTDGTRSPNRIRVGVPEKGTSGGGFASSPQIVCIKAIAPQRTIALSGPKGRRVIQAKAPPPDSLESVLLISLQYWLLRALVSGERAPRVGAPSGLLGMLQRHCRAIWRGSW